jgi:hypothetical protein
MQENHHEDNVVRRSDGLPKIEVECANDSILHLGLKSMLCWIPEID